MCPEASRAGLTLYYAVASDGYIYKSGQCHPGLTYIFNFYSIRALRRSGLSARMPEYQKLKCRLDLDDKM